MKTYVVGGAVRDRLLGRPVSDRDHVVVGATVDEMLAAGYKPVGRDFPVFLHPTTHEEYALARTERKVAPGYAGFVFHADPTVTLEADLERRDLTVNAIAEDEASGVLVDPFGGRRDLEARVFRHVGPAFAEDPVRLLRVARFGARFTDFTVAPETLALMRRMTAAGEVDALVPERVWQEVARGLMEDAPVRMIELLEASGAFARLFPELDRAWTAASDGAAKRTAALRALDGAACAGRALDVRFALFARSAADADGGLETLCARLAVPRSCREIALLVSREAAPMRAAVASSDAAALATVLDRCDAFRRRARFAHVLEAIGSTIDAHAARAIFELKVRNSIDLAAIVDAGAIARTAKYDPRIIAVRLRAARTEAIARAICA